MVACGADTSRPLGDTELEPPDAAAESTIALWNGVDLSEFSYDDWLWRVQDGAIVASAPATLGENRFLIYAREEFADFELRGEVWVGSENNSGVQYRSRVFDSERHRVSGYQADLGAGVFGMLYDEAGPREIVAETNAACASAAAEQWHTFRVRAVGNELTHWVDEMECLHYRDEHPARATSGVIALQYHQPGGYEVRFRNLQLTRL